MANYSVEAVAPAAAQSNAELLQQRRLRSQRAQANARWKTMDARTIASILVPHMLASRPEIGLNRGPYKKDKKGRKRYFHKPTPIFGPPTFRNVINENGEHV